ncbi:BRISC and BRCA1-A complex member 2 isoform X3 [Erinaceus europaeus]|uniref:BRISC and BRCA1-A complex member 2 n=1 Tax=Erinaceus europaeus TaxID=9365 RepID=A0ABM3X1S4_ERIEU|nr:BRISC and BRCA1-A complex member 2 isoform X3 [Erinaceus europaeus]
MSPEVALNRISPMLSPFISSVVRNGKVGLDATNCLRITDLKSGCTSLTPGPNCDRFKLHIPYAGETLKWDIIFNAQYPELPPDFIFGEDAEFLPDPSALHNLASWNPSNPECLLLVVKELVQQYHQFQCSRLRESSRLMFEYQTLLEEPQYGENMEIYAGKKNNWTGEFSARFLLKLPVDFSNIPTYLLKDVNEDPGEDVALLSVSFEDTEATQVYPKLYLSPRIEHALGGSSALHIPAFPGGGCLIDYVPQVCHLLTNKVQYVIQGYHKRREYIAAFLSHFGTGVVEYDAEGFTKLTLLLMWRDFCFLVHRLISKPLSRSSRRQRLPMESSRKHRPAVHMRVSTYVLPGSHLERLGGSVLLTQRLVGLRQPQFCWIPNSPGGRGPGSCTPTPHCPPLVSSGGKKQIMIGASPGKKTQHTHTRTLPQGLCLRPFFKF